MTPDPNIEKRFYYVDGYYMKPSGKSEKWSRIKI